MAEKRPESVVKRIGGYLHRVVPIVDEAGKVLDHTLKSSFGFSEAKTPVAHMDIMNNTISVDINKGFIFSSINYKSYIHNSFGNHSLEFSFILYHHRTSLFLLLSTMT